MKSLLKILVLLMLLYGYDANLVKHLGDFPDNKRTEQVSFYRLRFELSTTSTASRVTLENISNVLTVRRIGALNNPKKTGATMRRLWVASLTAGQLVGVTADYAITPDALREPLECLLEKDPDGESTVRIYNVPDSGDPVLFKEINHTGSDPLPCSVDLSPLQGTSPLRLTPLSRPRPARNKVDR
jgi:hypothetical protein